MQLHNCSWTLDFHEQGIGGNKPKSSISFEEVLAGLGVKPKPFKSCTLKPKYRAVEPPYA